MVYGFKSENRKSRRRERTKAPAIHLLWFALRPREMAVTRNHLKSKKITLQ